jgi:hypothetical protein
MAECDLPPYNTGVEENTAVRTAEAGLLSLGADAVDVSKSPEENADLDEARPNGSYQLAPKEGSWWNLHVGAHLQVLSVGQGLRHGNVTYDVSEDC